MFVGVWREEAGDSIRGRQKGGRADKRRVAAADVSAQCNAVAPSIFAIRVDSANSRFRKEREGGLKMGKSNGRCGGDAVWLPAEKRMGKQRNSVMGKRDPPKQPTDSRRQECTYANYACLAVVGLIFPPFPPTDSTNVPAR